MKITKYLLVFLCFIPLFIFRDFTPNNELKYLSIADEALRDGHFFTFWNHGVPYADKLLHHQQNYDKDSLQKCST